MGLDLLCVSMDPWRVGNLLLSIELMSEAALCAAAARVSVV